ncbi:MAG: hypothetical protein JWM99_4649 [Verrucomicrobiales bacterium]|nr:hypothetical protein [Verrucomicrobiales bacterium]
MRHACELVQANRLVEDGSNAIVKYYVGNDG